VKLSGGKGLLTKLQGKEGPVIDYFTGSQKTKKKGQQNCHPFFP